MTVEVQTFGCRLNAYESQVMKNHAQAAGLENTLLVNTCAVTNEAERQARQSIRRAKRENPLLNIIVTGCAAQINPQRFAQMPEVTQVIGNEEKLKAESYGAQGEERIRVNDIMSIQETAGHLVTGMDDNTRAFVQVQNGCNHRCTFCIIPFGRGNSRSVPMGEIVAQVRLLVQNGYREVVLTGVDISDYGKDLPGTPSLGQLMRRLLALVPDLPRLRVSSIDAIEMDEDFFRLLAEEPRLMPHLHVSLQAGDNMILKRMKRRHSREDALQFAQKVRALRPETAFGADIITGFPTETEDMFQNSLKMVEEMDLVYLHIFPYSERPGTPAARMPQVPLAIRKERAARLRAAGEGQLNRFLTRQLNRPARVLVEKNNEGRSETFAPMRLLQPATPGSLLTVIPHTLQNGLLLANQEAA